jgi:hypothetical protein
MLADAAAGNAHNSLQHFVAAAGHADDQLASHHLPDRRVFRGGPMPTPVITVADGLIWLRQSVERNSNGAQDGGDEDARPGLASGPAHLPQVFGRH